MLLRMWSREVGDNRWLEFSGQSTREGRTAQTKNPQRPAVGLPQVFSLIPISTHVRKPHEAGKEPTPRIRGKSAQDSHKGPVPPSQAGKIL